MPDGAQRDATVRLEPRPRVVEWTLLGALAVAVATGVGTLFAGDPADWWILALHGIAGLLLVVGVFWKLRRERVHLHPRRWSPATANSLLLSALAVGALVTGLAWVVGLDLGVLAWSGLVVHAFVGLLVAPVLLVHLRRRLHVPTAADLEGRRTALQIAVLLGGAALAWRAQALVRGAFAAADVAARYTGSRRAGGEGNDFPYTSWVADDPDPVDPDGWALRVHGAVASAETLELADLVAMAADDLEATLDCTSGWYAERAWRGVRVGRLLAGVEPAADARWVSFRSVTGYRFSLPIEEARGALLATHVGGERLVHGHGYPARLVAPGRRGYQWVKWVESVEVRTTPDYGEWWAIFTSGFSRGA